MSDSNNRFRRQFLLGSRHVDLFPDWKRVCAGRGLFLTVHPDLPCSQVISDAGTLTMLGYFIDPWSPATSDALILDKLYSKANTHTGLLKATTGYGGRWVLIFSNHERSMVFHDAAGLRQVFHTDSPEFGVWCGSQPGLIAQVTGAAKAVAEYERMKSDGVYQYPKNHFWPGSASSYKGIHRLVANHSLDLKTGHVQRYWPTGPVAKISWDEALEECSRLLQGSIKSAANKFNLAFSVTSGMESRLMMAAAKDFLDEFNFYTYKKDSLYKTSPDVWVPPKVLESVGLSRMLVNVELNQSSFIRDSIESNVFPAHEATISQAAALLEDMSLVTDQWVTMNGNICEIARCHYTKYGPVEVTPANLASRAQMHGCKYAEKQFGQWHEDASEALEASGVDPWDLFYWEQKLSAWLGSIRTEFDLIEEVFCPFNCRDLIEYQLGIDDKYRRAPDYPFYISLIRAMWPEALSFPINPPDRVLEAVLRFRSAQNSCWKMARKAAEVSGTLPMIQKIRNR